MDESNKNMETSMITDKEQQYRSEFEEWIIHPSLKEQAWHIYLDACKNREAEIEKMKNHYSDELKKTRDQFAPWSENYKKLKEQLKRERDCVSEILKSSKTRGYPTPQEWHELIQNARQVQALREEV